MTQDEIIEMARQAGIVVTGEAIYTLCNLVAAKERETLAQTQEPVAYLTRRKIGGTEGLLRADMVDKSAKNQETHDFIPLYKDPKPCPTCEALARTVMLDQTSHDTTSLERTWVGLTEEDMKGMSYGDKVLAAWVVRTLKEKNT